ncbi:MAG: response regulator [Patescibacteria group bacterium]|jgi:two-component system response regulator VicR|nr:response regulator [Patescibacteria group bacterium]
MANQKKVLFIEDEPGLIDIYHLTFDAHGYQFFSTADIEEGMIIAKTQQPDIILLDIILPEKSGDSVNISAKQGLVFLSRAKSDKQIKDIPVVVFTNLNSSADRQKAKELGAVDYLVKADNLPDEVFKKVDKFLNQ